MPSPSANIKTKVLLAAALATAPWMAGKAQEGGKGPPSTQIAQLQAAKVSVLKAPMDLREHCLLIEAGFEIMNDRKTLTELEGPPTEQDRIFENRLKGWFTRGCPRDEVPHPESPRSFRWFNATAGILANTSPPVKLIGLTQ